MAWLSTYPDCSPRALTHSVTLGEELSLSELFLSFFFKCLFLRERETERDREQAGEWQRERETENPKQALC